MRPPALPGSYLVLETGNTCSLACRHCSVGEAGHGHHARRGSLEVATAEVLFEDLEGAGARFDTLILFWLGEPLIHPQIAEIWRRGLRSAARGCFGKVELHTNATHLTAGACRWALNRAAVPQVWHFSIDACDPATYRAIKGRDRLAQVEENVGRFLAEKARIGARWPRPVFQFIVSDRNAAEAVAFRDRWLGACARAGLPARAAAQQIPAGEEAVVFFKQLDCPTPEEQGRQNAVFREVAARLGLPLARPERVAGEVAADNRGVCACFWKSPVIGWDGTVTTCTRDNLLQNAIGRIGPGRQRFTELWWGGRMRGARRRVASADYGDLPVCRGCFIPRSSNYTDITPAEIAAYNLPADPSDAQHSDARPSVAA